MMKLSLFYILCCGALLFTAKAKSIGTEGTESLEPYGYETLQESVDYNCEGQIKFDIGINQTNKPIQLRDVHLQLCASSWSNKWCTSPDSYFIEQPCSYKKVGVIRIPVCVLDIQTMCRAISSSGNWYHSVYVTKVVGLADGEIYSTRQFALSPLRYEYRCKKKLELGVRIRGHSKLCQISNFI